MSIVLLVVLLTTGVGIREMPNLEACEAVGLWLQNADEMSKGRKTVKAWTCIETPR